MKKTKPKAKKSPAFRILIPTKLGEIEKLFVHDNLVWIYERSVGDLRDYAKDVIADGELKDSGLDTERGQYGFVIDKMRQWVEETYEYEKNLIEEIRTKINEMYPAPGSGRRVQITRKIMAKVKELTLKGKSGKVIAKTLGLSLPSVQNIKQRLTDSF